MLKMIADDIKRLIRLPIDLFFLVLVKLLDNPTICMIAGDIKTLVNLPIKIIVKAIHFAKKLRSGFKLFKAKFYMRRKGIIFVE